MNQKSSLREVPQFVSKALTANMPVSSVAWGFVAWLCVVFFAGHADYKACCSGLLL
jgi:hypothetical protein